MSRIFFTNNKIWGKQLKTIYDTNYALSHYYVDEHIISANYKKLNLQNVNYYVKDDCYIQCVGTLIYNELFGEEALKKMLGDSEIKTVKELRADAIGSYAIFIKNSNRYISFVDETHTFFLYYFFDGSQFVFSNSCWHVAKIIGARIEGAPLLEMGVRRCTMSNHTQYKGIKKLSATEYFEIDRKTNNAVIKKSILNNYKQSFINKEQAAEYIISLIKKISRIRSTYIKKSFQFLTGGIDSRAELAIHYSNNDQMKLGYWIGDDLITNGTKEDAEIVSIIGKALNCSCTFFDVTENFSKSLASITNEKCLKYGDYSSIYSGNNKWFSIFENMKDVDSIEFGFLWDPMRPLSELDDNYSVPFSSMDYITKLYCRSGLEKELFQFEGLYPFIMEEIAPLIEMNKEDEKNLSIDFAFKLFSYSRFEADCLLNNFVNLFVYSFPILGCKEVADAIFSLKYEWVSGNYMSIRTIEELSPSLLAFPIYSHHRSYRYDKKTSTMKESFKFRFLDLMKKKFKNTFVYKSFYLRYAHNIIRPQSIKNDDIIKECAKYICNLPVLKESNIRMGDFTKWNGIDIGAIATFVGDLIVTSCELL